MSTVSKRLALAVVVVALTGLGAPATAGATPFFADVVLDFFNSGTGPIDVGGYGGTFPGAFPVPVPLCVVLGSEPGCLAGPGAVDFLSLPVESFVTVGFIDDSIIDGPGADFTVFETVPTADEDADIFVSTNFGASFVFIGNALGTVSFDLAVLGLTKPVNAIKAVSTGLGGSSPGYDLEHIQILNAGESTIPEPGTLSLLGLGLVGIGAYRRRRRS